MPEVVSSRRLQRTRARPHAAHSKRFGALQARSRSAQQPAERARSTQGGKAAKEPVCPLCGQPGHRRVACPKSRGAFALGKTHVRPRSAVEMHRVYGPCWDAPGVESSMHETAIWCPVAHRLLCTAPSGVLLQLPGVDDPLTTIRKASRARAPSRETHEPDRRSAAQVKAGERSSLERGPPAVEAKPKARTSFGAAQSPVRGRGATADVRPVGREAAPQQANGSVPASEEPVNNAGARRKTVPPLLYAQSVANAPLQLPESAQGAAQLAAAASAACVPC